MSDFDKLKIAYEVLLDLETLNGLKSGALNSIVTVKNIIANEIAYSATFPVKS